MDARAVGVFDSGVGGLTVLHECLVTMPNEDFVFLGDHARLPYGPRPLEEIRRFSREIATYLAQQDVKLIVVACNSATSAALPQLQEELAVPIVGVITPEAHAAVQATRNRRVGLLATAATVEAGRYAALVHELDAGVSFHPVACPRARAAHRGRRPVRRGDGGRRARVRRAAPGGRRRHRDPRLHALSAPQQDLRARLRPRRDARLLRRGDGARGGRDARAKGAENARDRVGEYHFLTTGDPEAFRELGRRFLQLPVRGVEHVTVATLEGAAA